MLTNLYQNFHENEQETVPYYLSTHKLKCVQCILLGLLSSAVVPTTYSMNAELKCAEISLQMCSFPSPFISRAQNHPRTRYFLEYL